MADTLHRSPLDARHRALGAKMVPFGGWEMPLAYPEGTLSEHRCCREAAVVFDVSHLGTVSVSGAKAYAHLQQTLSNDLDKIGPGRCQYTHLLSDDGSVADDVIVWWVNPERFDVMPNASNTDRVVAALGGGPGTDISAVDVTADRALLAVQGPLARDVLRNISVDAAEVGRFRLAAVEIAGVPTMVAGTGYTGEDGVEIAVPRDAAEMLFDRLLDAGARPAGLGARDTLRLEAGLPLHGHELGPGITPLNAGLGWVVGWNKPEFIGRDALEAQRESGVDRRLVGFRTADRRPPRAGDQVMVGDDVVGEVTSGNFSPMLEVGIALAFVDAARLDSDGPGDFELVGRRDRRPVARVELPFVG